MSESDPIIELRPAAAARASKRFSDGRSADGRSGDGRTAGSGQDSHPITAFNRHELSLILRLYGRMVAAGEWRDYALDMGRDTASFAVFRRTSEYPVYRIVKTPKLARRQGAYSVVAAGGLVLKRGADLARVLAALDKPRLVEG